MRKQRWLQRFLAIIGTGLERAGQALRGRSGEPDSKTTPSDPDGPPAFWLELLSRSLVPLVWVRQNLENAINPFLQQGWQKGVHFQGELPAENHFRSDEPIFPVVFPESLWQESAKKIEGFQEAQELIEPHQPERSGPGNNTTKPQTGMSLVPQPSIPSNPPNRPRYTLRNAFRLLAASEGSQPDHNQRANQTVSNMPRYIYASPKTRAELHWPEESNEAGTIASRYITPRYVYAQPQSQTESHWPEELNEAGTIAPGYKTRQQSVTKEVSFLEASQESTAQKKFFPDKSLSDDRWPSLPADRLATEFDASSTQLEQSHRHRLEQEWYGE